MRTARTLRAATLTGAAALILTGCVGGQADTAGGGSAPGGDEAETVLRFAHVYEPSHAYEACAIDAVHETLEGSGLAIETYPAAQLGSEAELLEQLIGGSLDVAMAGASFLGVYHEDAAVMDAAYLFDGLDGFLANVDSPEIQQIWDELEEASGLSVQSSWYFGTRHVTANTPISTPADLDGVKLRTPDAPLYITNTAAMGGTATPMVLNEVYTGLQQGAIDGQEAPIPSVESLGFTEVQDYLNLTGHIVQASNVVANPEVIEALPADQRTAWDEAMEAGAAAAQRCLVADEEALLEQYEEDGTITINDDVDREAFAAAVRDALPDEVSFGELYLDIAASQ